MKIYYLSVKERKKLFKIIKTKNEKLFLMFRLMYLYGLRASELTNLKNSDINYDACKIHIERLKNGIPNDYQLFRAERDLLLKYKGTTEYIFTNDNFGKLSYSYIYKKYRQFAVECSLPKEKQHPHCLRHTIAVDLLDSGVDIIDIKDWLGHKKIENTMVYLRITSKRRKETEAKVEKL